MACAGVINHSRIINVRRLTALERVEGDGGRKNLSHRGDPGFAGYEQSGDLVIAAEKPNETLRAGQISGKIARIKDTGRDFPSSLKSL